MNNNLTKDNVFFIIVFCIISFSFFLNIYINYFLKLSGDEGIYYALSIGQEIDNNLFLPGFSYYLSFLNNVFFLSNFGFLKIAVTAVNYLLIVFILYSFYLYRLKTPSLILCMVLLSPTYFYFLSSLWADTFSTLLFCSGVILLVRFFGKETLTKFILILIIASFLTLLRPQYFFFIAILSIYYFFYLFKNKSNLLKKIVLWILSNIIIFSPILYLCILNYLTYGAFIPVISPLVAELFFYPSKEFIEIASTSTALSFYDCKQYIILFAEANKLTFYEAANVLTEKYSIKNNSDFINVSLNNLYTFFWGEKYLFLERYTFLFCWGKSDCIFRDYTILLYSIEMIIRILFIIILIVIVVWPLFKKIDMRMYLYFISIFIIFVSLHCFGGNPTHGRYIFQFYPIAFLFFAIFFSISKEKMKTQLTLE